VTDKSPESLTITDVFSAVEILLSVSQIGSTPFYLFTAIADRSQRLQRIPRSTPQLPKTIDREYGEN
jgi:hypothetical protein